MILNDRLVAFLETGKDPDHPEETVHPQTPPTADQIRRIEELALTLGLAPEEVEWALLHWQEAYRNGK